MRNSLFSDLKSLSQLRKPTAVVARRIPRIESLIVSNQADFIKLFLEEIVFEKYSLDELFQLSENSEKIKTLFESPQCKTKWEKIVIDLKYSVKPGTGASVFQKLMGSHLAFYYNKWVSNDSSYAETPAAKELLREVKKRGIQNPCPSASTVASAACPLASTTPRAA